MDIIVKKFGGTSVANIARMKNIVQIVKSELASGNKVIVVVSAMAGVTNQLLSLCSDISAIDNEQKSAEYDVALSSGEMVTAALLALGLQNEGVNAKSLLAWQLPIITDANYGNADVLSVANNIINDLISKDIVPVIAGFQGITENRRCTTLGRGGSDTTAALIAAAIAAKRCDIYTDVNGVFIADPRIVHNAPKLDIIGFEEMLELAYSGAKVLHPRCVSIAMKHNIELRVLSSLTQYALKKQNDQYGTLITSKDKCVEQRVVTGITYNSDLLKITIPDQVMSFSKICTLMKSNKINIQYIDHVTKSKVYELIVQLRYARLIKSLLNNSDIHMDTNVATISIVGYEINNDRHIASKILDLFSTYFIPIFRLQIFENKIMLLIYDGDIEKSIKSLCKFFELCKV